MRIEQQVLEQGDSLLAPHLPDGSDQAHSHYFEAHPVATRTKRGLIQAGCRTSAGLSISRLAGLTSRLSVVST